MPETIRNTAGEIMTPEFVRLSAGTTAREGLLELRASGLDSDAMYTIYVTDADDRLIGALDLKTLLFAKDDAPVESLMDANVMSVSVADDQQHAAKLVRKYDLMSLPVTDEDGLLVGAIGVNSIVDVIEEENTEDFERMAGMLPSEESYATSSAWMLAMHRIPWLVVLLLSSLLCERVIQGYQGFLLTSGALGILVVSSMPLLMDAGGDCGSQSSTMIIRAIALGELTLSMLWEVLWKEVRIGLLCGAGLGAVHFGITMLIFGATPMSAMVVALSLLLTVTIANILGCVLPMLAHAVKLDPALMAGPLISTVADVCALIIMFSIATTII
ncbi:MAG: magnesium transporter [Clostridiales bacterium]|nr:magnesium transporter [Clostridiales bacterium]